ncbi:Caspase-3 [Frankliniella fusca]|uniref:Caspase-3 n=1 Tax=Frankliniella fusca TaxID=407009 RepID=A0AAE1H560_9NEOP|nr:Caspase-3 [Frankliniella fusca]
MAHLRRTRQNAYPIEPGVALIFNQRDFYDSDLNREGTDEDCRNLQLVFESMGYAVVSIDNCPASDFETTLQRAVTRFDEEHRGPFVLVFLTHGDKEGLYFSDCEKIHMISIRLHLAQHRKLDGKAKIIISPACRGNEHLEARDNSDVLTTMEGLVSLSDTIIMNSCTDQRDACHSTCGPIFISLICDEILSNMGRSENIQLTLLELSTKVNDRLHRLAPRYRGCRMITSIETTNTLRKDLYLSPKVDDRKYREAQEKVKEFFERLGFPGNPAVSNIQSDKVDTEEPGPSSRAPPSSGTSGSRRGSSGDALLEKVCGDSTDGDSGDEDSGDGDSGAGARGPSTCRVSSCKQGCATKHCGCRRNEVPCGERCHPGTGGFNQVALERSTAKETGPLSRAPPSGTGGGRRGSSGCSDSWDCGSGGSESGHSDSGDGDSGHSDSGDGDSGDGDSGDGDSGDGDSGDCVRRPSAGCWGSSQVHRRGGAQLGVQRGAQSGPGPGCPDAVFTSQLRTPSAAGTREEAPGGGGPVLPDSEESLHREREEPRRGRGRARRASLQLRHGVREQPVWVSEPRPAVRTSVSLPIGTPMSKQLDTRRCR